MVSKLSSDTKKCIQEIFGIGDDALLMEDLNEMDDLELDPTASQDYPMFTQSQSSETLKVCDICNFKTRSKAELQKHSLNHPKCQICKKSFSNDETLNTHLTTHRSVACVVCNTNILETKMRSHMENHNLTENYRKGLTKSKPKKSKPESTSAPRLNSFHVLSVLQGGKKENVSSTKHDCN